MKIKIYPKRGKIIIHKKMPIKWKINNMHPKGKIKMSKKENKKYHQKKKGAAAQTAPLKIQNAGSRILSPSKTARWASAAALLSSTPRRPDIRFAIIGFPSKRCRFKISGIVEHPRTFLY